MMSYDLLFCETEMKKRGSEAFLRKFVSLQMATVAILDQNRLFGSTLSLHRMYVIFSSVMTHKITLNKTLTKAEEFNS